MYSNIISTVILVWLSSSHHSTDELDIMGRRRTPQLNGQTPQLTFGAVQPLYRARYERMESVSRCLHMDDVEQSIRKNMIVPQRITNSRVLRNITVSN